MTTPRYDPARDSIDCMDTGERLRPGPKPNPEARRRPRGVKWSDAEWEHVQRCAKDADLTRSEWIRRACGL